ncbi:hypothetical protein ACFX2H_003142 [Malus domestica]
MASRKDQAIPTTNVKNKNNFAISGGTLGFTTQSKAKALSAVPSTPTLTLPKEQEHSKHDLAITLASLRVPREESLKRYSESLTSDADSCSDLYPVAMQVMTTSATSIEEQLGQMNEAIAKLTRTMEENNLRIATLVNRLEAQHNKRVDPNVDPPKEETDKKEEPLLEKAEEN